MIHPDNLLTVVGWLNGRGGDLRQEAQVQIPPVPGLRDLHQIIAILFAITENV